MRTSKLERQEAIFLALTEFKRTLGTENAQSINQLLKKHGVGHNHIPFIKAEMLARHLVKRDFSKWNPQMSAPTMEMAMSLVEAASKALTAYQQERKQARSEKPEEVVQIVNKPVKYSLEKVKNLFIEIARQNGLSGTTISISI